MVAPLHDYTQQDSNPGPTVDPKLNPATLPDGNPVSEPSSAQDLAERLNAQMQQNSTVIQQQGDQITQLAQQNQQSLQNFSQLAQSIADTQAQQQQAQQAQQQAQQAQAQQIQPPQFTQQEQEFIRDNPEYAQIVDKQANYLAQRAAQTMQQNTNQQLLQNRQELDQQLAEMRQANQQLQANSARSFNDQVISYAGTLGIDFGQLERDNNWISYMDRPLSPLSSDTVRSAMQAAAKEGNLARVQAGLTQFAQEFYPNNLQGGAAIQQPTNPNQVVMDPNHQQQQQQAPPPPLDPALGYPQPQQPQQQLMPSQQVQQQGMQPPPQQQGMPAPGAGREPVGQQQPGGNIDAQLQSIIAEQNEIRVERDRQTISGEEFDSKMSVLTNKLYQLQAQQQQSVGQT